MDAADADQQCRGDLDEGLDCGGEALAGAEDVASSPPIGTGYPAESKDDDDRKDEHSERAIEVLGRPDGGNPWRVGIRNPGNAAEIATVVAVADAAVATSGTYERGEHIWSPGSSPSDRPRSVTIMGPELRVADALATAAFAAGGDAPGWLHRFPEYRLLLL